MRESVAAAAKLPLPQAAEQEIAALEQLLKQFPSAVHCPSIVAHPLVHCKASTLQPRHHQLSRPTIHSQRQQCCPEGLEMKCV